MKPETDGKALLRSKGLRATVQREALLRTLQKAHKPLSVEAISAKSKVDVDLATVYRALQEFERLDLVRRVLLPGGKALYEIKGEHHHHLTCRTCGTIQDIDVCLPSDISAALTKQAPSFVRIEEHALEFFGTCRSCYASA